MRLFALLLFLLARPVFAVEPGEMLADPAQEARAQALGQEVRCPQCQNEAIEGSHADIARDLRLVIRERISAGDSDKEVLAYLTDRYGEFIRFRPRFGGWTLVLWLAAPALFAVGGIVAFTVMRSKRTEAEALNAEETARLDALMKDDGAG